MRLILVLMALLVPGLAHAQLEDLRTPQMAVTEAWTMATDRVTRTAGAYLTLTNPTDVDDALVAATSNAAEKVQLSTLEKLPSGILSLMGLKEISLPAKTTVTLQPGGLHLLLVGLYRPLDVGMEVPLTLTFRNARTQHVRVRIQGPAPKAVLEPNTR
jgi:copper(I)-binding protein